MRKQISIAALLLLCATTAFAQATAPKPLTIAAADLQKLKWIEGSWRGTGGGVPSVAISLDDKGITFGNDQTNRGTYRRERETADKWKAILQWPASGNRAAGERIYTMQRTK